jgi:hypothetical protein
VYAFQVLFNVQAFEMFKNFGNVESNRCHKFKLMLEMEEMVSRHEGNVRITRLTWKRLRAISSSALIPLILSGSVM